MAARPLIAAILVALLPIWAQAQDPRPIIQTMQQEPYSFYNTTGDIDGYHFIIANMILAEAGFDHKAQVVPIKRMINDVAHGDADCTIAASSPFAQKTFTMVEDIGYTLEVGILPKKGIDLRSYEDLSGLRIGVPAGMSIGDPFDSDTSLNKIETPDYEKSSLMLSYDRIDAIMGAIESVRYSAFAKAGIMAEIFGQPLVTQRYPFKLMCTKSLPSDGYVKLLKEATQRLRDRGDIKRAIDDFFSVSMSSLNSNAISTVNPIK